MFKILFVIVIALLVANYLPKGVDKFDESTRKIVPTATLAPLPFVNEPSPTKATSFVSNGLEAWIYPGEPACGALTELSSKKVQVSTLKIEYFTLGTDGVVKLLDEKSSGCNGFSTTSLNSFKQYAKEIYVTISGHHDDLVAMVKNKTAEKNVEIIVTFAKANQLSGVELDIEDFSAWSSADYEGFKWFVNLLGSKLHVSGMKLAIDGPAIANAESQGWYRFKWDDFNNLPVDSFVVMAYDYQVDQGAGSPITPSNWLSDVIVWTKTKINDDSKIVVGIPSYGYKATNGSYTARILTAEEIRKNTTFDKEAVRDTESFELMQKGEKEVVVLCDKACMQYKKKLINSMGIDRISVWHLGGNDWF